MSPRSMAPIADTTDQFLRSLTTSITNENRSSEVEERIEIAFENLVDSFFKILLVFELFIRQKDKSYC